MGILDVLLAMARYAKNCEHLMCIPKVVTDYQKVSFAFYIIPFFENAFLFIAIYRNSKRLSPVFGKDLYFGSIRTERYGDWKGKIFDDFYTHKSSVVKIIFF